MKYFSKNNERIVYEEKLEYIRCDKCKKKIEKGVYYEVKTGHNEWGAESVESIEYKQICTDCIKNFTMDYIEENKTRGSDYIEIEKERFRSGFENYDEYEDKLVEEDRNGDE